MLGKLAGGGGGGGVGGKPRVALELLIRAESRLRFDDERAGMIYPRRPDRPDALAD